MAQVAKALKKDLKQQTVSESGLKTVVSSEITDNKTLIDSEFEKELLGMHWWLLNRDGVLWVGSICKKFKVEIELDTLNKLEAKHNKKAVMYVGG